MVVWHFKYSNPFPKTVNPRYYIVPSSDPICRFDVLFIYSTSITVCKGNSWITGVGGNH